MVNLSKVPLHICWWKTIHTDTLLLDLLMIPAIAAGAFLGIWLVRLFPEKLYRALVLATTLVSAVLLFR
jgi:uncharacterized membrane protein YfcA